MNCWATLETCMKGAFQALSVCANHGYLPGRNSLWIIMQNRLQHQKEVKAFLQQHVSSQAWELTLPAGTGNETYFARYNGQTCFVKLGGQATRYQVVAAIGLTPQVLAVGFLEDGTSILVQQYIAGKVPSRGDYRTHLEQFASIINQIHHSTEVRQ